MTETKGLAKEVIPVKLILWATNILKLPSAARPARKKLKDIKTHLLDLELDPDPGVSFSLRFGGRDPLGIINDVYVSKDILSLMNWKFIGTGHGKNKQQRHDRK